MSGSRHHNYLSRCDPKGIAQSGCKKSKHMVLDLKGNKKFDAV